MASLRLVALAWVAGACLAGCSGASDSDLFATPASVAAPPDGGGSPPPATPDASIPAPTPAPDGGAPPPHDAGAGGDAAHPPVDAAPSDPGIQCGASFCDPAQTVCCRVDGQGALPGTPGTPTYTCLAQNDCDNAGGLAIACDDARDCAGSGGGAGGAICCVTEDSRTGVATQVACARPSDCTDRTQTYMCDPKAASACPNGKTCSASTTTIPGYTICHP